MAEAIFKKKTQIKIREAKKDLKNAILGPIGVIHGAIGAPTCLSLGHYGTIIRPWTASCISKQNIYITELFVIDIYVNSHFTRVSTPNQIGEA